jgi:hypothetical protein
LWTVDLSGSVASSYEHVNEQSDIIKSEENLEQLSDWQLHKKCTAPWTKFLRMERVAGAACGRRGSKLRQRR